MLCVSYASFCIRISVKSLVSVDISLMPIEIVYEFIIINSKIT